MKPWLILATVALLVFAWMFRYDVYTTVPSGDYSRFTLKYDRWTGVLYVLAPGEGWERFDARPEAEAVDLLQKPAAK